MTKIKPLSFFVVSLIIIMTIYCFNAFNFVNAQTPILIGSESINNADYGYGGISSAGNQGMGTVVYGNNYEISIVTFYMQKESGTTGLISGVIYRCNTPINGAFLDNMTLVDSSTTTFDSVNIRTFDTTNDLYNPELYTGVSLTFHNYNITTGYYYWLGFILNTTMSSGYVAFAYNSTGSTSTFSTDFIGSDDVFYLNSGLLCGSIIGYGEGSLSISPIVFRGSITGDIFNDAVIAQAPLQIALKQGITYTFTGKVYLNDVLEGTGNYSLALSAVSSSSTIFNYLPTSYTTYAFSNGTFTFQIYPKYGLNALYQLFLINITVQDSSNSTYITSSLYDLGFYGVGDESDTGQIPYPEPTNGEGGNDNPTSTVINVLISIFGNVENDMVFIIFGIICGLLTWKFAMTGLIAGIGISTLFCTLAGLLPIWGIGLCVVLDVTLIILGSGLLNKKQESPS